MLIQKMLVYWYICMFYREVHKGIKCTGCVYKAVKFNDINLKWRCHSRWNLGVAIVRILVSVPPAVNVFGSVYRVTCPQSRTNISG